MTDIPELARRAQAWYATLTPAEREAHDKAQRESFVRGQIGMGGDADEAACRASLERGEPIPEVDWSANRWIETTTRLRADLHRSIDQAFDDTWAAAFARGRIAGLEEAACIADEPEAGVGARERNIIACKIRARTPSRDDIARAIRALIK